MNVGDELYDGRPPVRCKLLPGAKPPAYANPGDSGMDLAAYGEGEIAPGETLPVRTGVFLEIPAGYEGQVRSRSGLAKGGVVVANSPGTVDSGYRGEILVLLRNHGEEFFKFEPGERIAQLVVAPVCHAVELRFVDELPGSARGDRGFGSSGSK